MNNSRNDDEKLCARFTGIFLNSNQNDLIEIFRYEETLIKTLKDIIYVRYYQSHRNYKKIPNFNLEREILLMELI